MNKINFHVILKEKVEKSIEYEKIQKKLIVYNKSKKC